jgi:hypothetical protein
MHLEMTLDGVVLLGSQLVFPCACRLLLTTCCIYLSCELSGVFVKNHLSTSVLVSFHFLIPLICFSILVTILCHLDYDGFAVCPDLHSEARSSVLLF